MGQPGGQAQFMRAASGGFEGQHVGGMQSFQQRPGMPQADGLGQIPKLMGPGDKKSPF